MPGRRKLLIRRPVHVPAAGGASTSTPSPLFLYSSKLARNSAAKGKEKGSFDHKGSKEQAKMVRLRQSELESFEKSCRPGRRMPFIKRTVSYMRSRMSRSHASRNDVINGNLDRYLCRHATRLYNMQPMRQQVPIMNIKEEEKDAGYEGEDED